MPSKSRCKRGQSQDRLNRDLHVTGLSRKPQRLEVASQSDIGRVRANNEDSLLVLDLSDSALSKAGIVRLVAVADGLGGHAAGGTASRMAIDCLKQTFTGAIASRLSSRKEALAILRRSFVEANHTVHAAGAAPGDLRGMGTTLVGALIGSGGVDICNVGDSRAYLYHKRDGLRQVTKDHSWEAECADQFHGDPGDLAAAGNLLTRALGPQNEVEIDEFSEPLRSGEILLLCSDGLSGMVDGEEIASVLASAKSMKAAVEELVKSANDKGGEDNITVIAVKSLGRSKKNT